VSLQPLGVSPGASEARAASGGGIQYRGTAHHVSTEIVNHGDGGVETIETLRSPDAPTTFSWRVSLDGVERLVPTSDGGINIVELASAAGLSKPPEKNADLLAAGPASGSGRIAARKGAERYAGAFTAPPPNASAGVSGRPALSPGDARAFASPFVSGADGLADFALTGAAVADPSGAPEETADSEGTPTTPSREWLDGEHLNTASDSERRQEMVLATIRPASSVDSQGRVVPTSLSVLGQTVTMHIDTSASGYVYPITADPELVVTESYATSPEIVQAGVDQFGQGVLTLDGHLWRGVGFNDYRLMNYPTKVCGAAMDSEDQNYELERIAATGANVIRVWFFQKYYQNNPSDPWGPYIHLLKAAAAHGLLVIPVLVNHWEQCDREGAEGEYGEHAAYTFYESGYESPQFGYTYSAKKWAEMVAKEFSPETTDSAAAGLWKSIAYFQIANEAEADESPYETKTCAANGAVILHNFAQTMATTIKGAYKGSGSITPLVSLGTMGIGQCGVSSAVESPIEHPNVGDYAYIYSAPAIDICEVHDYDLESVSDITANWYGIPYTSLAQRIDDCGAKPLVIGEAGIEANVQGGNVCRIDIDIGGSFCGEPPGERPEITSTTLDRRAQYLSDKIAAAFDNGVSGYLAWDKIMASSASNWNEKNDQTLGYGAYGVGSSQDPALCVMKAFTPSAASDPGGQWAPGEPPPSAASPCESWPVSDPGRVDHFSFVDGTTEGWGRNSGWGDLGATAVTSFGRTDSDSLKLSIGTGTLDGGDYTTTIDGHEYNPYSEDEVESDSVALLEPGSTVTMWVYRPSITCSGVEVKPVLRVNSGWDAVFGEDVHISTDTWQELSITVPWTDPSTSAKVKTINAVGLEVDAPSETDCVGESVYLDDVTW
jgi:hypothetical protein